MNSRVSLASIPSLTFYSDALTQSRRTPPIPQLKCVGKPCNLFQPDVVRCVNEGGSGTDVDWKCQADLPESLRFGRVEVSCEGWSRPGDPMVLKGSCALEYRLVRIPKVLQSDEPYVPSTLSRIFDPDDPLKTLFILLWSFVLLFILYHFLKSCFTRPGHATRANPTPGPRPSGPGGGWFPGHNPDDTDAPPPYTRHGKQPESQPAAGGWRPGFWTGMGLGGLAASMWGRRRDPAQPVQRSMWDWERTGGWWGNPSRSQTAQSATQSGGWFGAADTTTSRPRRAWADDDRGEGSSNLGSMRSSSGWGGSSVR